MKTNLKKLLYSGVTLMSLGVLAACSSTSSSTTTSSSAATSQTSVATISNNSTSSDSSSSTIDWSALPMTEVKLSNDGLKITEGGTYILTGSTTAGVTVETDANVRIILAGAEISSSDTAAINVINADNVELEIKDGTTNTVKDTSNHTDTNIEGAIHVEADLTITGNGSLTVEGNFQDGIVSTDDLVVNSGNITVTAVDDGIRGKDSLTINGGTINVTAGGDGIKSTNDTDTTKGYTTITGGEITVKAGDDGIKAETALTIDGGTITVSESAEALEGTNITINGGTLDVYGSDDAINAASTTSSEIFIKVTGGDLKVAVGSGDTDAFDANGDIYISGGTIDVTAQSAFDFDGTAELTGGIVTVNGEQITQITATGPGAGGHGGW
ncbi:carbohydrate-binding domain-containing protein [Streptococcus suis]|uniref:carbohydrate-binding domain-containing protein n=1 Tax=Streptococcus suis TaxID=1307 RepID=UPI00040CC148|nr:carbohydrate-binding domain-containing protein [Streptococcus suis]MBL1156168.1 carbohydrate-binding domain-containing protein [Streptococcus suis]MBL3696094.1 carbohydrate-binding domain-containing protein [Streptococcus suis]MBM6388450.1 carbohydrate-binding domain-containing protein [Streptococcus suis]MBP0927664.1 carbohydrate-binding domain-containing protein [Streptococcus suis]MCB2886625.1 carbohydrate-binding domain-containing protein [Streptococcus suis]